jgi:CBS domain-containing protein
MRRATVLRPDDPTEDLFKEFEQPSLRAVALVSAKEEPIGLVTDADLLFALLPPYVVEDPTLARVLEADVAGELRRRVGNKRVKNLFNIRRRRQFPVSPDTTLIEVTSAMIRAGDPAVLVVENDLVVGVIAVDDLLPALLHA